MIVCEKPDAKVIFEKLVHAVKRAARTTARDYQTSTFDANLKLFLLHYRGVQVCCICANIDMT